MLAAVKTFVQRFAPQAIRPRRYFESLARRRTGQKVISGPFAGMRYVDRSIGSSYIPKLLGIYERELAAIIDRIIAMRPSVIVDVGAAEGYYAVGLAWRTPSARVIAFETEESGRAAVAEMAKLNGVADRLEQFATCEPQGLRDALAAGPDPVLVMDVEGYEDVLLDPSRVPELARTTILVELHEFVIPGITDTITRRLEKTHRIEHVWAEDRSATEFPWRTVVTRLLPHRYTGHAVSERRPPGMSWYFARPIEE